MDELTTPTPKEFLLNVTGHVLLARALAIATDLGVADLVADGPKSVDELVEVTGCHGESLYRLLRMLAGHGVFADDGEGRFGLTPRAELLRTDHPESLSEMLLLGWQDIQWQTYLALPEAVMTGDIAFEQAHGQGFFDYLAAHPDLNAVFDRRMSVVSRAENDEIARAYAFDEHASVIDIGGGQGGLLAAIVERHPNLVAALYEQPQVLAEPFDLREAGLLDKVARIAGNFFDDVPSGFGLYVMKRIIHDWDDDRAAVILRCCRDAMTAQSRVLVIDAVIRPGNEPDPNKNLDLSIMALTPGRERTEEEFSALFDASGLRLKRIIPTEHPSTLSLLEAERAG